MKIFNLLVVFILFLLNSCGNGSEENSFEKTMEEARKEVANMDVAVSTYSIDSSKNWFVISEIKRISQSGNFMTTVKNDFRQNNQSVKEISNEFQGKVEFLGQIIIDDSPNTITLCHLMRDEQNVRSVYRISIKNKREYSPEKIDSATSKEWKDIVEKIYTRNTASK